MKGLIAAVVCLAASAASANTTIIGAWDYTTSGKDVTLAPRHYQTMGCNGKAGGISFACINGLASIFFQHGCGLDEAETSSISFLINKIKVGVRLEFEPVAKNALTYLDHEITLVVLDLVSRGDALAVSFTSKEDGPTVMGFQTFGLNAARRLKNECGWEK